LDSHVVGLVGDRGQVADELSAVAALSLGDLGPLRQIGQLPGKPVELDVEIWPSCIVLPPGYRLCLSVRGKDYEYDGPPLLLDGVKYSLTGVGPFLHAHPKDRPKEVFGGAYTLHFARGNQPYVLLPVIPPK